MDRFSMELALLAAGLVLGTAPGAAASGSASDPDGGRWIVAQHDGGPRLRHLDRRGRVVEQFPSSRFDANANDLVGVRVDPSDGTLWIGARDTRLVYHVTRRGALIHAYEQPPVDPELDWTTH